jgi:hypothetical protein
MLAAAAGVDATMTTMTTETVTTNGRPMKRARVEPASPVLLVKRLSEDARLPVRGSAKAAGYDLCRWVASVG